MFDCSSRASTNQNKGGLFLPAVPLECRLGGEFGGWTNKVDQSRAGVAAGWTVSSVDYFIIAANGLKPSGGRV